MNPIRLAVRSLRERLLVTRAARWRRAAATPRWCAVVALASALGSAGAQVGLGRIEVGGQPVSLVYPTAAAASRQRIGPFEIEVALDAAPAAGRHRLVVLSHGTGGSALADHALAATLARAGFVVAQPLHAGDNHADMSQAGPPSWRKRPREVSSVIDALAADPRWAPILRLDRVGVHGMSAGGVTALSLAGAQWRTLNLVRHCQQHLEADIGFCLNGAVEPARRAERLASFERARGVPEFFLPRALLEHQGGLTPPKGHDSRDADFDARPDPRIAAVTLAVPVAAIFDAASLGRIAVPVGVVAARNDEVLVPAFHSAHVLAHCRRCTLLTELPDAGHFDVLAPWPAEVADSVARQQIRGGAPHPAFEPARRAAAQAMIADFHRRHLQAP